MTEEKKTSKEQKSQYGLLAFIPLIVFLALFIGSGIYFTASGTVERPWSQMPRQTAVFAGVIVACLMCRKISVNKKIDKFIESASRPGIIMMVIIFLLAGAFSGMCKATLLLAVVEKSQEIFPTIFCWSFLIFMF